MALVASRDGRNREGAMIFVKDVDDIRRNL